MPPHLSANNFLNNNHLLHEFTSKNEHWAGGKPAGGFIRITMG